MEDITYLSSIEPEAEDQQVTARRRPSFSEVSFENEPDLVSAASNPSSLGDIYPYDEPTYHGGISSIIEITMDSSANKRKPSHTMVLSEYQPQVALAASNPSSLGDIYPYDEPTYHGGISSIIEITMDSSANKRKPSHTMVSSEYQPQVALAASNPSSLGDIYPYDEPTYHGGHSSIIEITMDSSANKRKPSHTMVSSEYQPQVALAASNPSSLGDIYPYDEPTRHGGHSSRTEPTMDPSAKDKQISHTMVSSENQPDLLLDLEESPGNIYFDDTLSVNSMDVLCSESDRLSPMLEKVKVEPIPIDPITCVAESNQVDTQHLKTIMLDVILQDLDGDNVNQDQNQGAVAQERSVRFEDVTSKLLNTEVLEYRTRRDLTKIEALRTLMTLVNENKLSVDTRDGDVIVSHYKGPQKTFLTESEDENMIFLEVFQPMATENTFCQFQMMKNRPLLELMISYCIFAEIELSEVKFVFDGKVVTETDTPESLQMENEDFIAVYYK